MFKVLRKIFSKAGVSILKRRILKKTMSITGRNKTIEKWDKSESAYAREGFKQYWELLEEVRLHQFNRMADGRDILEYVYSLYPPGKKLYGLHGLMIGCVYGRENAAVSIARTGIFETLTVIDIAGNLLGKQQELTAELGLNHILKYERIDLNTDSITGSETYDLIWANGTIHHIKRLEGLFSEINESLAPDGIFCMKEYVGPSYLQFTDKQLEICNSLLRIIPDDLKKDCFGQVKTKVSRPTVEKVVREDPSEAVRSGEILSIAGSCLKVLESRSCGGTILHPLLSGIAGNFEKNDTTRKMLRVLIDLEELLLEEGEIEENYLFMIASKKTTG